MKKSYIEMNTFSAFLHISFWSCKSRHATYIRSLFKGIGKISWCSFKGLTLDSREKAEFTQIWQPVSMKRNNPERKRNYAFTLYNVLVLDAYFDLLNTCNAHVIHKANCL